MGIKGNNALSDVEKALLKKSEDYLKNKIDEIKQQIEENKKKRK